MTLRSKKASLLIAICATLGLLWQPVASASTRMAPASSHVHPAGTFGENIISSLTCPTRTVCYASGYTVGPSTGIIITFTNGRPTKAQHFAGNGNSVGALSCPTPSFCAALTSDPPQLVILKNGIVSRSIAATITPGVISCPSAEECVILGRTFNSAGEILATRVYSGGELSQLEPYHLPTLVSAATTDIEGLSCATISACEFVALSDTEKTPPGAFLPDAYLYGSFGPGGSVRGLHISTINTLEDIACFRPRLCYVAGEALGNSGNMKAVRTARLWSLPIGGANLTTVSTSSVNGEYEPLTCYSLAYCTAEVQTPASRVEAFSAVSFSRGKAGALHATDTGDQPDPISRVSPTLCFALTDTDADLGITSVPLS